MRALSFTLPIAILGLIEILGAPAALADGVKDGTAGLAALDDGRYAEAVRLFTKALSEKLSPADEELAYVKRGEAYLGEKRYRRALKDLNAALALDSGDQEAIDMRARMMPGAAPEQEQASAAATPDATPAGALPAGAPTAPGGLHQLSFHDPDGNDYNGNALGKKPEGDGVIRRANGDVFEGSFHDGAFVSGHYTYVDGDQYTGSFQDNQPSGDGTYSWVDGITYTGTFEKGQPNGSGTFTYPDGRRYTGEVQSGAPDGQGTLVYRDGHAASGLWKAGRLAQPMRNMADLPGGSGIEP